MALVACDSGGQGTCAHDEDATDAARFVGPVPTATAHTRTYYVPSPEAQARIDALTPERRAQIAREIDAYFRRRLREWPW